MMEGIAVVGVALAWGLAPQCFSMKSLVEVTKGGKERGRGKKSAERH